jgi:hypothetical protein
MPSCVRCQREIAETRHQGAAYRIDGYRLHTGKTKRTQTQDESGHVHHHLQLYDPQDVHLCIDCFAVPVIAHVWLSTFPGHEEIDRLRR